MTRILVIPEALRDLATMLERSSQELEEIGARTISAYNSLAWEGTLRARMTDHLERARADASRIVEQTRVLSSYVRRKAGILEEADVAGATGLNRVNEAWSQSVTGQPGSTTSPTPTPTPTPATPESSTTPPAQNDSPATEQDSPTYDGQTPAPGTTRMNAALPVTPPMTNLPGSRSASAYNNVIDQFAVENNPRYAIRDSNGDGYDDTFCNIFVWDVTKAMGAEVPHWVYPDGTVAEAGAKGAYELNANGVFDWMKNHGSENGWRVVTAEEAQAFANDGKPVVATWHNPTGGAGHVAMVRPGSYSATDGPSIAQAGSQNVGDASLKQGFGNRVPLYYVHD
ncbi:MAG: hypothetical protein ACOY94_18505 [Bacillota bacterium]